MYSRMTSFVGDARRRLSGAAVNNADGEEKLEDFSHHVTQTTRDDEECEDEEYEEGEGDDEDVEMTESRAGLVNYGSDDDADDGEADNHNSERMASVDDLFAPGELEQRLAEEAAGIDPYAVEYGDSRTDVDEDDLERRRADFDDDVEDVDDENRAIVDAVFDEIRRKAAADQAAADAANTRVYAASESSSSIGTITTCTGSDYQPESGNPAAGAHHDARELKTPPPQDLAEPKTPDLYNVPLTKAERIALRPSLIESLVGAPRLLILRTLLGRNHGTECEPSAYGPHTPFTSPGPSPAASDLGIDEDEPANDAPAELSAELAAILAEASIPANRLRRTFDGDYFTPDGTGGYISTRTRRHVDHVWQRTFEHTHMLNNARYHEAHRLAHNADAQSDVAASSLAQPTQPARSPSVESEDIDMAGYDTSDDDSGDCPPSPVEGTSSQMQQDVEPPVHAPMPSPSPRPKRARSEDDTVDDDVHTEKRRRVQTEAQPGSPPAARARAGRRTRNQAGSSAATTRSSVQDDTAAATAPAHQSAAMAIVEHNEYAANGFSEMHIDSLPVAAAAGPSRQPAQEPTTASPKRQYRRRGRAVLTTPTEPARRSTRIREKELARADAATKAHAAAEATGQTKTRRGKRGGNGRA